MIRNYESILWSHRRSFYFYRFWHTWNYFKFHWGWCSSRQPWTSSWYLRVQGILFYLCPGDRIDTVVPHLYLCSWWFRWVCLQIPSWWCIYRYCLRVFRWRFPYRFGLLFQLRLSYPCSSKRTFHWFRCWTCSYYLYYRNVNGDYHYLWMIFLKLKASKL